MHNYYEVTTIDSLIESVEKSINNPNYDSAYQKKLEDFLKNKIKKEYGNIPVVHAKYPIKIYLIKKYNKKGINEILEEDKLHYNNKEFANIFEEKSRLQTKSKKYFLISIEYPNGNPVLIVGVPDGLNLEGNRIKIYEVKSFNLDDFIQSAKEMKEYSLIKKISNQIEISSHQLISYQYLLKRTQEFGLIRKPDVINLYGEIYLYSGNKGYLIWAIETIRQDLNTIKIFAKEYSAYNLSLKDYLSLGYGGTININNKEIYYLKIGFRVTYSLKIVKYYLKNLDEIIKSLNYVDNRNL